MGKKGLLLLFVVLTIQGCASRQKVPVVVSSAAELALPYTRDIGGAAEEVMNQVKPLLVDSASKEYCENAIAEMINKNKKQFILEDSPEDRDRISKKLAESVPRDILSDRRNEIFAMRRALPNYSRNGSVFAWNVSTAGETGSKGAFRGQFTIGENFCYYNSSSFTRSCNDRESYTYSVDGTYSFAGDSLTATYQLLNTHHESSIGLDSKLYENILKQALSGVADTVARQAKAEIDSNYKRIVSSTTKAIQQKLDNRVLKGKLVSQALKEVSFSANFETSVARLQRRLDKFKYDKDSSTFVFTDERQATFLGKNLTLEEKLTVKLFPEKTTTVAVYEVEFTPVTDELTGRDLYSKDDAVKRLESQIASINAILKK